MPQHSLQRLVRDEASAPGAMQGPAALWEGHFEAVCGTQPLQLNVRLNLMTHLTAIVPGIDLKHLPGASQRVMWPFTTAFPGQIKAGLQGAAIHHLDQQLLAILHVNFEHNVLPWQAVCRAVWGKAKLHQTAERRKVPSYGLMG